MPDEIITEEQLVVPGKKKAPVGPLIGILIILTILLVGGLYYLSQKIQKDKLPDIKQTLGTN